MNPATPAPAPGRPGVPTPARRPTASATPVAPAAATPRAAHLLGGRAIADLLSLHTPLTDPAPLLRRIEQALRGGSETQRLAALGMLPLPGARPDPAPALLSGVLHLARHGTPAERAEAMRCLARMYAETMHPATHALVPPGPEDHPAPALPPLLALPASEYRGTAARAAGPPADETPERGPTSPPGASGGSAAWAWLAAAAWPARPLRDPWTAARRRSFLFGAAAAVVVLYLRYL